MNELCTKGAVELAGMIASGKVKSSKAGCVVGRDYPEPVVDHAVQRDQALALYRSRG